MAINKKLIHFKKFSDFNLKKLSANEQNTQYTLGVDGAVTNGAPEILYQSICWIKDEQKMWTHGTMYSCDEKQFKTVNGESILGEGNIINYTPITYSELKALRDNSQLIPGMQYRITDYETRVRKTDAYASANHKFDIIVLATSENTLSEEARAIKTDRDWEVESGTLTVDLSQNGDGSDLSTVSLDSNAFESEAGTNKFLIVSYKGTDGSIIEPIGRLCYKSGETMVYNDSAYYKWYILGGSSVYVLTEKENPDKDDVVIWYEEVQEAESETTEVIYYVYDTEKEYYLYYNDNNGIYLLHTSNQLGVGDSFKYMTDGLEVLLFDLAHTLDPENYPSELPIIESTGSEGPYFEKNNLEAWKLWYTLDNDANKYHWADVDTFGSFEYYGYTWEATGFSKDVIMIGGMVMEGDLELPDTENGELVDIGVKMAETRSNGNFFRITSNVECVLQQKYDEVTIDGVTYDLITWPYFYGADPSTASTLTSSTTIGINNATVYQITDNVPALMAGYTAEAITDESIIAYSTNYFDNICFTIGRNPADKLIFDTYGLYSSEYYVMEPVTLYEFYSSGPNEIAYANFEYDDSKRFIFYSNGGGGGPKSYTNGASMSGNNMYFYDYNNPITTVLSTASKGDGRGIIYRMIDEFGNDCPYDFKNIVYNSNPGGFEPISLSADSFASTHGDYAYTFSYMKYIVSENSSSAAPANLTDTLTSSTFENMVGIRDLSIIYGKCDNNKIGSYYNYEYEAYDLPLIVFTGSMGGEIDYTKGNVDYYYNYDMYVHNNTIGNNCCQLFLNTDAAWGKIQNFEVNSFVRYCSLYTTAYSYQGKKKVVYNDGNGIEVFEEVAPASESDIQNIVQPQINTLQTNINTTNTNLSNLTTRVSNLEANSLTDDEVDTLVTNNLILEE